MADRAKTTEVCHPHLTGVWPDGEPESVRDAADRLARGRRGRAPVITAPRQPADGRVPARRRRGRS